MSAGDLYALVGGTPLAALPALSAEVGADVYAKLEGHNPAGSVKDRPASYILRRALEEGRIDSRSHVVESSSGNFGVGLAAACRQLGLRFTCVVDGNVTRVNRYLMEQLGARVEKVGSRGFEGGDLGARLARVHEILAADPSAYWPNQYANAWNWRAHYVGTGREIVGQLRERSLRADFLFATVSSGGTITGCSRALKEAHAATRTVAVDIEGSVIFGGAPGPRHVPGPGSSRVPEILDRSCIDHFVRVSELEMIGGCRTLLRDEQLFVGGSSGAVVQGLRRFFSTGGRTHARPVVVVVFPDRGERYFQTLYDDAWIERTYGRHRVRLVGCDEAVGARAGPQ